MRCHIVIGELQTKITSRKSLVSLLFRLCSSGKNKIVGVTINVENFSLLNIEKKKMDIKSFEIREMINFIYE